MWQILNTLGSSQAAGIGNDTTPASPCDDLRVGSQQVPRRTAVDIPRSPVDAHLPNRPNDRADLRQLRETK
jgi:hypothetical protein